MANALIAAHVIAALLFLGPITVAASRFPRQARAAAGAAVGGGAAPPSAVAQHDGSAGALAVAGELHRITRGYAAGSVAVPALGIGVASYLHLFSQRWLIVSIVLTVGGAALLAGLVVPAQARALTLCREGASEAAQAAAKRAGATAGMFGTVWVAIAILMVVRPRLGQ